MNYDYNKVVIIGMRGEMGSGKDTVGNYLVNNYGFVRVAFADTLKEACKLIFQLTDEQVYGNLKEVIDPYWQHSPRELLQRVGTELFRDELPKHCKNISDNVWIRSIERQIQNLRKKGYTKFVITDVRFPNEIDFIIKNSSCDRHDCFSCFGTHTLLWKTIRERSIPSESHTLKHVSETMVDNYSNMQIFNNDSSLNNLYHQVDFQIAKMLKK